MFTEDDLLPISALQHLLFCERQCALIHVEGLWADNRLTVEGSHLHRKVDAGGGERRHEVRTARSLSLRSFRLGLVGKADTVEFHGPPDGECRPFPVEYKRGKPKRDRSDEVQLCAQALCLEEMLECAVTAGALFYGTTRRRHDVAFDAELRRTTEAAAARLHQLVREGHTPPARRAPKCDSCSMLDLCLPAPARGSRSVRRYLENALANREPLTPDGASALVEGP